MSSGNPLLAFPNLAAGLSQVEEELRASVRTDDPFLTEVAGHLILAGGKRVRPGFSMAAALAVHVSEQPVPIEAVMGGVACELVHLGSLYHDDVMDEAATRRGADSVNARWNNLRAILAGDYLLARASEIAASLGTEVAGLLANTIARLCEGQVRELQDTYNIDRTEADYLVSIDGKTASLLATSCRIGGIVADLPRDLIDTLTTFGHSYGMAFQVVDDILDITATDEQLGKPAGNDVVEGVFTLPVLRALETEAGPRLRQLLTREAEFGGTPPVIDLRTRDEARALVRASGAVEASLAVAQEFASQAVAALDPVAATAASAPLRAATDHLLERVAAVAG
ncbi:MAG: polyprenyl synthetase family protein [Acidimicrobiales bacterium]|nr:polyprenyl synthetase family protein [Acidimicrobiales bacterium]